MSKAHSVMLYAAGLSLRDLSERVLRGGSTGSLGYSLWRMRFRRVVALNEDVVKLHGFSMV